MNETRFICRWRLSRNAFRSLSVGRWAIATPRRCTRIQRCSPVRRWFLWNDPNRCGNSMRHRLHRAETISRRTWASIRRWWCAANPGRSSNSLFAAMLCSFRRRRPAPQWPIRTHDGFRAIHAVFDCPNRIWWPETVESEWNTPLVSYSPASMHKSRDWQECLQMKLDDWIVRTKLMGRGRAVELTFIGMQWHFHRIRYYFLRQIRANGCVQTLKSDDDDVWQFNLRHLPTIYCYWIDEWSNRTKLCVPNVHLSMWEMHQPMTAVKCVRKQFDFCVLQRTHRKSWILNFWF